MKTLNNYINEALIKKDTKIVKFAFYPKDFNELRDLIEQLLEERGKDADLNDINVSQITTFYDKNVFSKYKIGLFEGLDPHNIDISQWNVSNVKNMDKVFYGCENFNCDLSGWDVSEVKEMWGMFANCKNFNFDLSKWDISNVKDMEDMFDGCRALKNKPAWYWYK